MNHVPLCCDHDYVRTDGWLIIRFKLKMQCRFVIKRGHIFTIPSSV